MNISQEFQSGHDDLIHDVNFNYYGNRFVTCSSDHKLKVWDKKPSISLSASWKAHDAAILKTSWAHPEFGQVLCSCSFDRTVKIWEEQEGEINGAKSWIEKCKLGHAKATIEDVSFAPNFLGLKIACCSADGILRIYEAMDPMNLSDWILTDDFEIIPGGSKEPDGQFCLSWCPSKLLPPMMVVGCGKLNTAKIFRLDSNNNWAAFENLSGHSGLVRAVAWAPSMGRSYQLIATGSSDGNVRIYHLTSNPPGKQSTGKSNMFSVEMVGEFPAHQSDVWRVEWNVTGTVLASSGDDGVIRLWKSSFLKEYKMIGVIEPGPQQ